MNTILKRKIRQSLGWLIGYYELFAILLLLLPPSQFPLIGLESTAAAWPLRLSAIMLGALGLGLFFPLVNPLRHWAITALIAFGQVVMPTVTVLLISIGDLPAHVGAPMALVDLLFLVPAVCALVWSVDLHALETASGTTSHPTPEIAPLLAVVPDGSVHTVGDLSAEGPILVLLLRHLGCTFCRATLSNLSENISSLRTQYRAVLVVTMSPLEEMLPLRERNELPGVLLVSDPERLWYRALSIPVGSFRQTLGWRVLARGLFSGLLFRYGIGTVHADPFQLPGSAVIERRQILWTRPATDASEPLQSGSACQL